MMRAMVRGAPSGRCGICLDVKTIEGRSGHRIGPAPVDATVRDPRRRPSLRSALVAGRRTAPDHSTSSVTAMIRSEEHTSELQSRGQLVCRLLLEKTKANSIQYNTSNDPGAPTRTT